MEEEEEEEEEEEGHVDSQVLFLDGLEANERSKGRDIIDSSEKGYRRFTYAKLVRLLEEKDVELDELRWKCKTFENAEARRRAAEADARSRSSRGNYRQKERLADFVVNISANSPPVDIGVLVDDVCLRVSWQPRRVRIVGFDIARRMYRVAGKTAQWWLQDATETLGQEPEKDGLMFAEMELHAECFVLQELAMSAPCYILRHRSHLMHVYSPKLTEIAGLHIMLVRDVAGKLMLLQEREDDFMKWKKALKSYIHSLLAFKYFEAEAKRRKDRQRLNTQRKRLLDGERWRIFSWHYDDVMTVFEFQGFRYDGKPLGNEERVAMENPTAEFEVARKMFMKMARTEMERRERPGDSQERQWMRERWTLPNVDKGLPQRPWETTDLGSGQLNTQTMSCRQAMQHLAQEHLEGLDPACIRACYVHKVWSSLEQEDAHTDVVVVSSVGVIDLDADTSDSIHVKRTSGTYLRNVAWIDPLELVEDLKTRGMNSRYRLLARLVSDKTFQKLIGYEIAESRLRRERKSVGA
eukprot:g2442.t1